VSATAGLAFPCSRAAPLVVPPTAAGVGLDGARGAGGRRSHV